MSKINGPMTSKTLEEAMQPLRDYFASDEWKRVMEAQNKDLADVFAALQKAGAAFSHELREAQERRLRACGLTHLAKHD